MSRIVLICLVLLAFACGARAEDKVTITPRVVTEAEIIASIKAAALDQGFSGNPVIKIGRLPRNLISSNADDQIVVESLDINKSGQSFSAEVSLDKSAKQKITILGRIIQIVSVPVLNVQRNQGENIADADIAWVDMEQSTIGNNAITNAEQLIGKNARRLIASGTVIRTGMVSAPVIVRKNDLIMVVYQTDYMTISHQARALTDGAMGETIRALNTQTNKILDAVVSGSGQAMVGGTTAKKSLASK